MCDDDVFAAALPGEQAKPALRKGLGCTCLAEVNYRGQFPLVLGVRPEIVCANSGAAAVQLDLFFAANHSIDPG